ncbi:glutamate-5-semialdehyde dehydrogenase [bacterium 210820-DFI.6.52]|nr:glutamate-5-semialdehyde dehydrogenase [bacterium 210820-DFI.6.52]
MTDLTVLGGHAKAAARELALLDSGEKNRLLAAVAQQVRDDCAAILQANGEDVAAAREAGISESLIDRLLLNEQRVLAMADAAEQVAALPDPVGRVLGGQRLPSGLEMTKVSTPLGVCGIIYEARPNVTLDAAALCLKSSNAVILKGGKEALRSNRAVVASVRAALAAAGQNPDFVQLIEDSARETTSAFMKLNGYLDVLIPRGGAGLIRAVVENATVPVIETGTGNCHIYVEGTADLEMAADIAYNAKVSRPSVCNAAETFLVDRSVAAQWLPVIAGRMAASPRVEIRGCPETCAILGGRAVPAVESDWESEFLDYVVAIKVVDGFEEAVSHIQRYTTGHSECIVTRDYEKSQAFCRRIDAAAVYVNASTRFTDGGEFGMGAEIGISTQKLHARGPMGLEQLTTYKYILQGDGQIR